MHGERDNKTAATKCEPTEFIVFHFVVLWECDIVRIVFFLSLNLYLFIYFFRIVFLFSFFVLFSGAAAVEFNVR